ncbi:hypothetical protein [Aquimarina sp. 2201CG5-10]|uniref:hypothetical protein n=1 Tax=Aquimarina callyspongiae TaxID=3098150 RepID=UPI002AB4E746|nr:hypothetical protein [Aquimarina sp. 2201CG5-10]MDY8135374.1 hypothetical protein [Aquimarina sp. 2201CG5-10]
MTRTSILLLLLGLLIFTESCQHQKSDLTKSEKKSIIDSAKTTVQKVFDSSNNLKFIEGLNYYSADADAFYVSNGTIHSLSELKESYNQIGSSVELLENSIDSWNSTILSENTVAFTLPIHLKIKLIGIPEYNGQLVWSGIVQKRNEKWVIIQSHESWLNCVEMTSALTK